MTGYFRFSESQILHIEYFLNLEFDNLYLGKFPDTQQLLSTAKPHLFILIIVY
jgi:hypothetical protein